VDADDADQPQHIGCHFACPFERYILRFHNQPSGAKQRITEHYRNTRHHRKARCPIKWTTGEITAINHYTLHKAAKNHALAESGTRTAKMECHIP
jgi:hypothetical protein